MVSMGQLHIQSYLEMMNVPLARLNLLKCSQDAFLSFLRVNSSFSQDEIKKGKKETTFKESPQYPRFFSHLWINSRPIAVAQKLHFHPFKKWIPGSKWKSLKMFIASTYFKANFTTYDPTVFMEVHILNDITQPQWSIPSLHTWPNNNIMKWPFIFTVKVTCR